VVKLNDLIPELKKLLQEGKIETSHAYELVRLTPADQKRIITGDQYGNNALFDTDWKGQQARS
jgi:hypothetical protein